MKIATIVGARPEFIKAAAVSRAISAHNHAVCPTAQAAAVRSFKPLIFPPTAPILKRTRRFTKRVETRLPTIRP